MIDFEFEDEDVIEPDTFHCDTRLFRFGSEKLQGGQTT
jgi:hypothetical protein